MGWVKVLQAGQNRLKRARYRLVRQTDVGPRKLKEPHKMEDMGAIWRMRFNNPWSVAMRAVAIVTLATCKL